MTFRRSSSGRISHKDVDACEKSQTHEEGFGVN